MNSRQVYDDMLVLGSAAELLHLKGEVNRLLGQRLKQADEDLRKLLGPDRTGDKKDDKMVRETRVVRSRKGP